MQDRLQRIAAGIYACVSTLSEVDGGWMPRTMLYLAITDNDGMTARIVERSAEKAGFIEVSHEIIKITEKGRKLAAELDADIAAERKAV